MKPESTPSNEAARLATLARCAILDTAPEQVYDDVACLAARICDAPIAYVGFVDDGRQWFKARFGLEAAGTPRDAAFAAHAILGEGVLEVADAAADERFASDPLVTGPPHARFFAGAPIVLPGGHAVGAVCVVDAEPRRLEPEQRAALEALSRQVASHLELRQRQRSAAEMAASLQRVSHLFAESQRMARVGGWSLDLQTREVMWTEETYRIHDTSPAVLRPTVESTNAFFTPDALPVFERAVARAETAGRPFELELELVTAKGRRIWVLAAGKPVFDGERATHVVGAFQDVTDRRRVSEELRAARDAAEEANRRKTEFLATMSHEIRTPMNAVLGYASLLEETRLDVTQRDYLGFVERSGQALLGLIDDILDYARIEAGRMDVEQIAFDLHTTLEDVVRMLEPRADDKGIELRAEIGPEVPRCIAGDPSRLGQVLLNLAGNAVKFTSEGSVVVAVQLARNDRLRIEVRDTGIGIAPDRVGRLFEEFERQDTRTRQISGTGLGLAISRRIVELMNGRIGVESAAGKGSTFWLEVPLLAANDDPAARGRDSAPEARAGAKTRVLLAEDNPVNQHLAREFLIRLNCDVDVASNGVEAVELAMRAEADYSLILMDCLMPEMDGYEATREIRERERPAGNKVPIVAITTKALADDRERCAEAGMDDCLDKPFRRADLERLLGQWAAGSGPDESTAS